MIDWTTRGEVLSALSTSGEPQRALSSLPLPALLARGLREDGSASDPAYDAILAATAELGAVSRLCEAVDDDAAARASIPLDVAPLLAGIERRLLVGIELFKRAHLSEPSGVAAKPEAT
jgi:hypothetical protein